MSGKEKTVALTTQGQAASASLATTYLIAYKIYFFSGHDGIS